MSELHQYAHLVKDMRDCQKKFFETRDPYWITKSKQAEKAVDKFTEDIINPPAQKSLFDGK